MRHWLMKSEPDMFGIEDLKKKGCAPWDGVRNFQARNFMRDMKVGDLILFYHSSCEPPGVAGVAQVSKESHPDYTSWDKKGHHFDPRSTPAKPLWFMVEVEFVEKLPSFVSLERLKADAALAGMRVLQRGSRLSVQPVEKKHFDRVLALGHPRI
jgi:predicted RNA-binding protein with PUA-like domain